ncbi:Rrf2 family transcriptional regulator [Marinilabiliaceae bacterium JC017]|nr:Rrf2 family transcriptional regulator [Marinilabiliaceae bacterium JC017]
MFSRKVYYGLRFLLVLASRGGELPVGVGELAVNEGLPVKFMEAIAVSLRKHALVNVKRGAGGGYRLAKPLDQISLYEVVAALEDKAEKVPEGESHKAIAVEKYMDEVKNEYHTFLESCSLKRLKELLDDENQQVMYYI